MNREYLFKGKKVENGEWVEGYYQEYSKEHACIHKNGSDSFQVDPETICQFTRMQQNLWENDIVKTKRGYIGIVQFGKYNIYDYGFYLKWIKGDNALRKDLLYWIPEIEVIGNRFDNPEFFTERTNEFQAFENAYEMENKMLVRLNTIENVNDFVKICNKYSGYNVDVKQGRQIIDGRSILGIYSLNLMKDLEISIDAEDECIQRDFYNKIKKWETVNGDEMSVSLV